MLDTAYYNERLVDLRLRSELNSTAAYLLKAIDVFDSVVIGCLAEIAARTGSPISSQEALGDYVAKGTGNVGKFIARAYKAIFNMGVWVLKMIKNMIVYAIKGFPGTVGGAMRTAKKIGARIADMQKTYVPSGISPALAERAAGVITEHATYVDVKLNNGRIDQAKKDYINAFNSKMKSDAKIDNSFVCTTAPNHLGKVTLSDCDVSTSADLVGIGAKFLEAEKVLKKRLDQLKKEGDVVKSVCKTMKAKGFSEKSVKGADSVKVLAAAYHAAILANDMKYLNMLETSYINMVHTLKKASKNYVA